MLRNDILFPRLSGTFDGVTLKRWPSGYGGTNVIRFLSSVGKAMLPKYPLPSLSKSSHTFLNMSITTFWLNVSLPSSSNQSPLLLATIHDPIPSDPALGAPGIEDQDSPCYDSECISSSNEDTKEESDFDNGEELEDRDDMLDEGFVAGLSFIESTRESDATVMGLVAAAGGTEDNLTNSNGVPAAVVASQGPGIGSGALHLIDFTIILIISF